MANRPILLGDDIEVIERRTDARTLVSLPGRFMLTNRRDMLGQRREYPCRAINVSCQSIALATFILGELGERVIAHIDQFGRFEGPIVRQLEGGFLMDIVASKDERLQLAAKIDWYERHKNHEVADHRQHARIIPRDPYSTLVLADGTTNDCLVKDVSASGVAVHADHVPAIGDPVAVGKVVGRVVRHLEDGFAVNFSQVQDPQSVEGLIARLG